MVLSGLPTSGRDDQVNGNPERFNIDRSHNAKSNLTFSTGADLCLAHLIAKQEIRILTEEWINCVLKFSAMPGMRNGFRIKLVHAVESLPLR